MFPMFFGTSVLYWARRDGPRITQHEWDRGMTFILSEQVFVCLELDTSKSDREFL